MERLHEQLRESLYALITSEDWQQALAVAARFHDYSFANTQLIWSQAISRGFQPSRVAGYRTWQKVGRQVRRGEHGLAILAPVTRRIEAEDGEEERRVVGFRPVHVFDLSQTDGEPLPEVETALIEGDLPVHWEEISELIAKAGFSMQVADVDQLGNANGITDWRKREVVVRASLPGAQRFKTAVHELGHINLHEPNSQGRPNCRGIVEVEAESVAYVVCAALGMDSAGYSLPYVASWSGGDLDKVAATADRVIRCAHQVLSHLETERHLERDHPRARAMDHPLPPGETESLAIDDAQPRTPAPHQEIEEALRLAVSYYQDQLRHSDGSLARAFLAQRGFNDETVDRWHLGYAPASWDSLLKTLRSEHIPDEILLESGLAGRARTGRLYDHMRGRIIFPVLDRQGAPRGFAGRLIVGDGPKYLNSPETPLYKKSSLLYGLHLAEPTITESHQAVIVEGYTDAIATHQAGITNAVATGGTALTAQHLEALGRITATVILAFDGDRAGLLAAERTADLDTTPQMDLLLARLPEGQDPASLVADGGSNLFHRALADAIPLEHHLIDQIVGRYNLKEPEAVARATYRAGSLIALISDPTARERATTYLAQRIGRSETLIKDALAQPRTSRERNLSARSRGLA